MTRSEMVAQTYSNLLKKVHSAKKHYDLNRAYEEVEFAYMRKMLFKPQYTHLITTIEERRCYGELAY